jgi:hypothetical protein
MNARRRAFILVPYLASVPVLSSQAQNPTALAAAALADSSFTWIRREAPGFRVYFLAGSYAAANQDSLLAQLRPALGHARSLISAPALDGPIDLFFIESRAQMIDLIGGSATGFAQPSTRTVLLVTNPEWRAFERHEIMHVVVRQAWGPPAPGTAWLQEGLAQAADGACAGYSNTDVLLALTRRHGWIPFDVVLTKFREQPDVRAYLQAAAFTDHLLRQYGPRPLESLWRRGARPDSLVRGDTLTVHERRWKEHLTPRQDVGPSTLAIVESKGCG